ncbi:ankyrin repeat domain-containing protein [Polymorphobacter fuscus]|uniref:Uncharacterized protein n=1 Tax=Sandarakinorhabdus fusca TaxID=1439888 RepID=A0A7C9KGS0_9SPHN|nr:ankyrin repeat domain-containing protein [Polymorphobacter fuscus]KAB7648271.1 hypothetical protein F9290_00680 [Polymorphobacter fuscus]MQT15779.1 hypothetical protein [Polymorphobacter fuscus]NJC07948.1 hypothetical protein [Polymorphobacter fuscus]
MDIAVNRLWLALMVVGLAEVAACRPVSRGSNMAALSIEAFASADDRAVIRAVASGDVAAAIAAAKGPPSRVNAVGSAGETPLLIAVERGDVAMVKALLAAGANPDGGPDRTPLHPATRADDMRMLDALLQAGADPSRTHGGETPLYEAALIGAVPAIERLVAAGAKVEAGNSIGMTPALTAAGADHWAAVAVLLEKGASPWTVPPSGHSVASFANTSRVDRSGADGVALAGVVARLKGAGYPWPPPSPPEIRKLRGQGQWPPRP